MRCLAGVLSPYSGTAKIDGRDIFRELQVRKLKDYMSTESSPDPFMSVDEYLEFWREFYGVSKERLDYLIKLFPTRLDAKCSALSSGQKKRVELIRTLIPSPKCLLLDEPVANLGPSIRQTSTLTSRRSPMRRRLPPYALPTTSTTYHSSLQASYS